jgi:hypothetical protein
MIGEAMTPEQTILAILESLPGHAVRGKKRLQKLAYLSKIAGLPIEADFRIESALSAARDDSPVAKHPLVRFLRDS